MDVSIISKLHKAPRIGYSRAFVDVTGSAIAALFLTYFLGPSSLNVAYRKHNPDECCSQTGMPVSEQKQAMKILKDLDIIGLRMNEGVPYWGVNVQCLVDKLNALVASPSCRGAVKTAASIHPESDQSVPPEELKIQHWGDFEPPGESSEFYDFVVTVIAMMSPGELCNTRTVAKSWIQKKGSNLWAKYQDHLQNPQAMQDAITNINRKKDEEGSEILRAEMPTSPNGTRDLSELIASVHIYLKELNWSAIDATNHLIDQAIWDSDSKFVQNILNRVSSGFVFCEEHHLKDLIESLAKVTKEKRKNKLPINNETTLKP